MKYYEVLKGNVGGFGNKTHKKGSTVTDAMFPNGNAKTLETMGFLKSVKAPSPEKKVKETKKSDKVEPVKEVEEIEETDKTDSNAIFVTADGVEVNELDDSNKQENMYEFKSKEIDFDPSDKKQILFELLKA